MRLFARIGIIIAAALVVVAITFGIGQSSAVQAIFPALPERGASMLQRPSGAVGGSTQPPTSGTDTPGGVLPRDRGAGPSVFGIGEVLKNGAIIAVIMTVVVLGGRTRHQVQNQASYRSAVF